MKNSLFILAPIFFVITFFCSCQPNAAGIKESAFFKLMNNVAIGWSTQNTDLALSSFDKDAIYMEPPNIQYYRGQEQLRPYFDELDERYSMKFQFMV